MNKRKTITLPKPHLLELSPKDTSDKGSNYSPSRTSTSTTTLETITPSYGIINSKIKYTEVGDKDYVDIGCFNLKDIKPDKVQIRVAN